MSLKRPLFKAQRGDTIVEVIVVLAILGLALSISYATASQSLLNTRQAEEQAQATELLQAQIEVLRDQAQGGNMAVYPSSPGADFYFDTTQSNLLHTNASWTTGIYTIKLDYTSAPTDTWIANATWTDVTGRGQDSVTLIYRAHQI